MTTRKRTTAKAKQAAEEAAPSAPEPTPETAEAMAPDIEPAPEAPTEIAGNEITGDGTGNTLPPIGAESADEMPGLFVRTKRRIKSRRRAGYRFNREGTSIALALLTAEQIQQLRSDPALEVEDCTFPVADAIEAPGA